MPRESIENHAERWQQTQQFVALALAEGVHQRPIEGDSGWNSTRWARALDIIEAYTFTSATHKGLAKTHNTAKQGINQAYARAIRRLHRLSPLELQQRFPLDSLVLRKPTKATRTVLDKKLTDATVTNREIDQLFKQVEAPYYSSRSRSVSGKRPILSPVSGLFEELGVTVWDPDHADLRNFIQGIGLPVGQVIVERPDGSAAQSVDFTLYRFKKRIKQALEMAHIS